MFYEVQSEQSKNAYVEKLQIIGKLSGLSSESASPYLHYRNHENIFCDCFGAENIGRKDCSADAKIGTLGIGLKTWVGSDNQKVAEFNRQRPMFKDLGGIELIKKIATLRNSRIKITMNSYGLESMIYHIVKREPGEMVILEHGYDYIDVENVKILKNKSSESNIYFSDGKHVYHFSLSKSTLYMAFDDCKEVGRFKVDILDDPFEYLKVVERTVNEDSMIKEKMSDEKMLCLRLYSTRKGTNIVCERSGLNQWNAKGRPRDPNEVYIPYPTADRKRIPNFFPERDTPFELTLPNGKVISAKVCQDSGKAIMSNPNKVLGEWLLRDVFNLSEGELLTYEMLQKADIDSVVFTKHENLKYSVDFATIGTYEDLYKNE